MQKTGKNADFPCLQLHSRSKASFEAELLSGHIALVFCLAIRQQLDNEQGNA